MEKEQVFFKSMSYNVTSNFKQNFHCSLLTAKEVEIMTVPQKKKKTKKTQISSFQGLQSGNCCRKEGWEGELALWLCNTTGCTSKPIESVE